MAEPVAYLELASGERIPVVTTAVIGRSSEADAIIMDSEASRRHAEVRAENGVCTVTDLGSRNGTSLNGQPLNEPARLQDGDEITIGRTTIIFRAVAQTAVDETVQQAAIVDPTVRMTAAPASPMQVLGRINRAITGITDAKQLADAVTLAIKDDYGCEGASLILVEPGGEGYYFASAATEAPGNIHLAHLERGEGIAGRVIEGREPLLIADTEGAREHAQHIDAALGFSSRSIVAAPVVSLEGKVLGALEAVNPTTKPAFDSDDLEFVSLVAGQLGVALSNARSWKSLDSERAALTRVAGVQRHFIATAPATIRLISEVSQMHAARIPVFVAGEPGTGKRLLARLTHESMEAPGRFLEVDAADGVGEVLELLDAADAGDTLYITGAFELPVSEQERLGTRLSAPRDASSPAVYVAGGSGLLSLLSTGELAASLHGALETGQLVIPPLRDRSDEFDALLEHCVSRTLERLGRQSLEFSPDAVQSLHSYGWPGNVRELETAISRAGILSREPVVGLEQLHAFVPELAPGATSRTASPQGSTRMRMVTRRATALEQLKSADPGQRNDAISTLRDAPGREVGAALASLLDDPIGWVRVNAAEALAARGGSWQVLVGRLEKEADPSIASRLLELLAGSPDAADEGVVRRGLRAGDPRIRREAMRTIRRTGNARHLEIAREAADDPDAGVRAEAVAARVHWGDAGAAAELESLVATGTPDERAAALAVAGELGSNLETLMSVARSGEPLLRVAAIRALGTSGAREATGVLVSMLDDPEVHAEVATALGAIGSAEAVAPLARLALDPGKGIVARRAAARALGMTGSSAALQPLLNALADDALTVAALEALSSLSVDGTEDGLLQHLERLTGESLELAVRLLGATGSHRSVRPLLSAAVRAPGFEESCYLAILAIADRSEPKQPVLAELVTALEDEGTRSLTLQLLGEAGDASVVPAILEYRGWSQDASLALAQLGSQVVPAALAALDGPGADAAEETLAEMGADAIPALIPLLEDETMRRHAMRVLERIGEAALPAVLTALEGPEGPGTAGLLQLAGRIGGGRLAAYVLEFLDSERPEVRYAAMVALGDLPDGRGERALLERLDSPDRATRLLAMLSLGRARSTAAFDLLVERAGSGDGMEQYAISGALANYNLQQAPVVSLVPGLVRNGMPCSTAALEAALAADALTVDDVRAALASERVPTGRKLWLITAIGRLPSSLAVPVLAALIREERDDELSQAVVTAYARHERAIVDDAVALLLDPLTRARGRAVLFSIGDPATLLGILRVILPRLGDDETLRETLVGMGDLLLGPLLDVIYESWDLDTLGLLLELAEVVESANGKQDTEAAN